MEGGRGGGGKGESTSAQLAQAGRQAGSIGCFENMRMGVGGLRWARGGWGEQVGWKAGGPLSSMFFSGICFFSVAFVVSSRAC